jgi:hypothetical protein
MSEILSSGGSELAQQARVAWTVSESPAYIELKLPGGTPLGPWPNGPLALSPTVVDQQGQALGGILVWVEEGAISLLEQFWYTDAAPLSWPLLDNVRFQPLPDGPSEKHL